MAVIKLGQMLHKGSVGPVTAGNPLDTEDVNSTAILTALGLVSQETTLINVVTEIQGLQAILQSAIVEEGTAL